MADTDPVAAKNPDKYEVRSKPADFVDSLIGNTDGHGNEVDSSGDVVKEIIPKKD